MEEAHDPRQDPRGWSYIVSGRRRRSRSLCKQTIVPCWRKKWLSIECCRQCKNARSPHGSTNPVSGHRSEHARCGIRRGCGNRERLRVTDANRAVLVRNIHAARVAGPCLPPMTPTTRSSSPSTGRRSWSCATCLPERPVYRNVTNSRKHGMKRVRPVLCWMSFHTCASDPHNMWIARVRAAWRAGW